MKIVNVIVIIVVLVFTGSCVPPESHTALSVENQSIPYSTGNPSHDRLSRFSQNQRYEVFTKAISDNDASCVVNRDFFFGISTDKTAIWHIGCTNGKSYQIIINADEKGTNSSIDCGVSAIMGIKCFQPPAQQ